MEKYSIITGLYGIEIVDRVVSLDKQDNRSRHNGRVNTIYIVLDLLGTVYHIDTI